MRRVAGATGVVGGQLVPMPVNGGHEVRATTTTSSKASGPPAAGTETTGHAGPGLSRDRSDPDHGATRGFRGSGDRAVAVGHEGAHVRPIVLGDQPATGRGNANPMAAVWTTGGAPVV